MDSNGGGALLEKVKLFQLDTVCAAEAKFDPM